jgi:hypothetical protein
LFLAGPCLRVIQRNTVTSANLGARFSHPTQILRMMFEAILEPVLVRAESDQDSGRATVTSDQDSSSSAKRRYFERSSFTAARATSRGPLFAGAFLVEPRLGFGFPDEGEDLDLRFSNVIEHPDVIDAQAILRLTGPAQAFDRLLLTFVGPCLRCRRMASLTPVRTGTGKAFNAATAPLARTVGLDRRARPLLNLAT